jgi:hypothetical protein
MREVSERNEVLSRGDSFGASFSVSVIKIKAELLLHSDTSGKGSAEPNGSGKEGSFFLTL